MDWLDDKVHLAIHENWESKANDAWRLIDPDTGGDQTWSKDPTHSTDGQPPATHIWISTPMTQRTWDVLRQNDAAVLKDHLETLADERGRTRKAWMEDESEVEALLSELMIYPTEEELQEVAV